jgi:hypothetical protein
MSEHGWPDFHDDGLHHDDGGHHEDLPQHEEAHDVGAGDDNYFDLHHDDGLPEHDSTDTPEVHQTWAQTHEPEPAYEHEHYLPEPDEPHELSTVGADPDALPEPDLAEVSTVFPPVLDVGPLPEPVDGFPWIDTGSLGLVDPATVHAAATEITPQDLAEYAGTDLPPGADPWAALADSDDPATSALAKWWSENS